MYDIFQDRKYKDKNTGEMKRGFWFLHQFKDIEDVFNDTSKILNGMPEDQRVNLHFTTHLSDRTKESAHKVRGNWSGQHMVPIDIDEIDQKDIEGIIQTVLPILKVNYDEVPIVSSGHGLHIYILTSNFIDKDTFKTWKPYYAALCTKINEALILNGLSGKCDPGPWRPHATLRLPNTINKKEGLEPVKATIIQNKITRYNYLLPDIVDIPRGLAGGESIPKSALLRLPSADTQSVLDKCNFLKWMRKYPNKVSEDKWFAGLSVLAFLDNGRDLCHEYSQGHNNYSAEEVELKVEHIKNSNFGPRTCADIHSRFTDPSVPSPCLQCDYHCDNQVGTPYRIQGENYIETSKTKFHQFKITKEGIITIKETKPSYEDVCRQFKKENEYLTTEDGNVWIYEDSHWSMISAASFRYFTKECWGDLWKPRKHSECWEYLTTSYPAPYNFFGNTAGKFNFQNGVLDFETGELSPHSTNHGFTYILPYDYDKDATCPRYDQFMDEITLGDKDLEAILDEFAGYGLSGSPNNFGKALMLHGYGANGKSVWIKVMKAVAGYGNYSNLLLSQLNDPESCKELVGKLFNIAEETPRYLKDSEKFKNFVTGGPYTVNMKYRPSFVVEENKTKLIMSCNELPNSGDLTHGLSRRMLIVPFQNRFTVGKNADINLDEKLAQELPGIFNRVVQGYQRLVSNNRFTESKKSWEALSEYKVSQNSVAAFVDECLEVTSEENETGYAVTQLYGYYINWIKVNQIPNKVTKTNFGKQLNVLTGKPAKIRKVNGRSIRFRTGIKMFTPEGKPIIHTIINDQGEIVDNNDFNFA